MIEIYSLHILQWYSFELAGYKWNQSTESNDERHNMILNFNVYMYVCKEIVMGINDPQTVFNILLQCLKLMGLLEKTLTWSFSQKM